MEMENVLRVNGVKKHFLFTDRLVRKGFRVIFTNAGAIVVYHHVSDRIILHMFRTER